MVLADRLIGQQWILLQFLDIYIYIYIYIYLLWNDMVVGSMQK
jgi:hypothetical protein